MALDEVQAAGAELRTAVTLPARPSWTRGVLEAVARRVAQAMCGVQGHTMLTHFERNRVTLRCAECGHESSGWDVGGPRPVRRYAGDPARHALARTADTRHRADA